MFRGASLRSTSNIQREEQFISDVSINMLAVRLKKIPNSILVHRPLSWTKKKSFFLWISIHFQWAGLQLLAVNTGISDFYWLDLCQFLNSDKIGLLSFIQCLSYRWGKLVLQRFAENNVWQSYRKTNVSIQNLFKEDVVRIKRGGDWAHCAGKMILAICCYVSIRAVSNLFLTVLRLGRYSRTLLQRGRVLWRVCYK